LDLQNKYVGCSSIMNNAAKSFDILLSVNVQHNYFDGPTKLFSDLYLAKFLVTSAKLFFPCKKLFFISIQNFFYLNNIYASRNYDCASVLVIFHDHANNFQKKLSTCVLDAFNDCLNGISRTDEVDVRMGTDLNINLTASSNSSCFVLQLDLRNSRERGNGG